MERIKLPDKDLLTAREVADYCGVTVYTVWRWIHEGKIRAKRVQGRILIPRDEVEKMRRPGA